MAGVPRQLFSQLVKGILMERSPSNERFSSDTPITQMGVDAAHLQRLSEAGKKLTKSDLVELWSNKLSPRSKAATLSDIEVVKEAFQPMIAATTREVGDVNCCCTPCCCAQAVLRPVAAA
jgi:hypothetical protein